MTSRGPFPSPAGRDALQGAACLGSVTCRGIAVRSRDKTSRRDMGAGGRERCLAHGHGVCGVNPCGVTGLELNTAPLKCLLLDRASLDEVSIIPCAGSELLLSHRTVLGVF